MTLKELKERGIFKMRVNLEEAFDKESPYREVWTGLWLEFRELTSQEALQIKGNELEIRERSMELFGECLIDHNLVKEAGKASRDEVLDLLRQSSTVYFYALETWTKSLPLAKRSPQS